MNGPSNKEEVEIFDKYFDFLNNKTIEEIENFHSKENLSKFRLTIKQIQEYKGKQFSWTEKHTNATLIAARDRNFNLIKYYIENEQFKFDINFHDTHGHL